ncbi:MAG: FAD-dependent oxidoreductase [Synechococcaceae cyanobacterium SM2_3_60]|nr:FAD-dependent oxidoreductase [Synechococcaceae cyanobacterium SM2_3_60]
MLADDTSPAAVRACEQQLQQWFCDCPPLRHLRSYRIPFAQFQQPPGFSAQAPTPLTPLTNLFLTGEYLYQSSIEGAIASGEKTALELLK